MNSYNIFIPGHFDDAVVYMGRLLGFTRERTIRVWSTEAIAQDIQLRFPAMGELPTLLFSRNDYLESPSLRLISASEGVQSAIDSALEAFPVPHLELNGDSFEQEIPLRLGAKSLLNVLAYGRRLYIGTEQGLFDIEVEWESSGHISLSLPERRLESRCVSTTAKFGAILASCSDDGLWSALTRFPPLFGSRFKQHGERSVRANWLAQSIVNYRNSTDLSLLTNLLERPRRDALQLMEAGESRQIVDVGLSRVDVPVLFQAIHDKFQVDRNSIQFVYNDDRVFFIHTYSGQVFSAALSQPKAHELDSFESPKVRFLRETRATAGNVISASPVKGGVVFEKDTEVSVLSQNVWFPIVKEPAVSVRTFPLSRRSRNLVVTTLNDGLLVSSIPSRRTRLKDVSV